MVAHPERTVDLLGVAFGNLDDGSHVVIFADLEKAKRITPELAEPDHPHFHHTRVHQERILIGLVGGDRVIGVPISVSDRAAIGALGMSRVWSWSLTLFQRDDGDAAKLPFPGVLVRQVFDDSLHRCTDVLGRLVLRRGFLTSRNTTVANGVLLMRLHNSYGG